MYYKRTTRTALTLFVAMPSQAMNDVESDLLALVDLISSQVKEVIADYHASGYDVPSIGSTDKGPFNIPVTSSLKFTRAIQILESACEQFMRQQCSSWPYYYQYESLSSINHCVKADIKL